MTGLRAALALAGLPLLTGGCVAAAIPVVAGGWIAGDRLGDDKAKAKTPAASALKAEGEAAPLATPEARVAIAKATEVEIVSAATPVAPARDAQAVAERDNAPLATAEARAAMGKVREVEIVSGVAPRQSAAAQPRTDASTAEADAAPLTTPAARAAMGMIKEVEIVPAVPGPRPAVGAAGEDAAYSLQAYQSLWTYLSAQVAKRRRGEPLRSVVLAPDATLGAPRYLPCQDKPLAVIFDLDENPTKSADPDSAWRRWRGDGNDALAVVPGAIEGVEAVRRERVTAIFSTRRGPDSAAGVAKALERLGFGALIPGDTLRLRGGDAADATRQRVSASQCVIALVGDSLGDFSDLFAAAGNAGRQSTAATETMVAPLWGAGWFLLPNPVRSTMLPSNAPAKE